MRALIVSLSLVFAFAAPSEGANLCVKTGGSNATVKADIVYVPGNEAGSTCWQTIGRGVWGNATRSTPNTAEAVAAGDTLYVFGGTYNFNSLNCSASVGVCRFTVLYNPVNTGTLGNYVTITCVGDCIVTAQEWNGPAVGASSISYVKWFADVTIGHSWQMQAYSPLDNNASSTQVDVTSDTGPAVIQGGTGLWIEGMILDGGPDGPDDNHNAIRIENCTDCVARNNYAANFHAVANHGSLFTVYHSPNLLIEHNHSVDNDGFLDFKNQTGGGGTAETTGTVRLNRIEDNFYCFVWSITEANEAGNLNVYQNVCSGTFHGIFSTQAVGMDDVDFFNNTFYAMTGPIFFIGPYSGVRAWNLVVNGADEIVTSENATMPAASSLDLEHNAYFGFGANFYSGTDGPRNYASFNTAFDGQHDDSPASTTSDPRLANPAGGDFRLCTGAGTPHASCAGASPAINIGVDALDLDGDLSTVDNINAGASVTGTEVFGIQTSAPADEPSSPRSNRLRRGGGEVSTRLFIADRERIAA